MYDKERMLGENIWGPLVWDEGRLLGTQTSQALKQKRSPEPRAIGLATDIQPSFVSLGTSFTHSFNQLLPSTHYLPGIMLSSGDTAMMEPTQKGVPHNMNNGATSVQWIQFSHSRYYNSCFVSNSISPPLFCARHGALCSP